MTRMIHERKARGEKGFTLSGFIRDRDKQERRRQEREDRIAAEEIKKVIEKEASLPPVERIRVGDRGYWIELRKVENGTGRELYAVFNPDALHLINIWIKETAEAACAEHAEKGTISR
jgi:hypothetical protein